MKIVLASNNKGKLREFNRYHGLPKQDAVFFNMSDLICSLARTEDCIIMGRCADAILRNNHIPHVSLFISAPFGVRVQHIMAVRNMGLRQAARFLKNDRSGEVPVLEQISGIQVLSCEKSFGFSWTMTPQEKQEAGEYYTGLLRRAFDLGADLDVLVLDEICGAVSLGFIDEKVLLDALSRKPKGLEVVMTGRNPSEALLELADYVTEMKALKHPYEKGIEARAGIEY